MNINTNEFEHLSSLLTDAKLQPLMERLRQLELENDSLKRRIGEMETAYENIRFENHWMRQYILLSVEKVREFFSHIRNIELLAAVKSFVMGVLPESATDEQIAYANKMMSLPTYEEPQAITMHNPHFEGAMYEVHDNKDVKLGA